MSGQACDRSVGGLKPLPSIEYSYYQNWKVGNASRRRRQDTRAELSFRNHTLAAQICDALGMKEI